MKRLLLISSLFLGLGLFAQSKVISNPAFEVTTTGIYNISKVELSKEATRVTVHCNYIPNWWVKFGEKAFIQDADSDEKYFMTSLEGGVIGAQEHMPESGERSFVLTFPPLGKNVKRLNFGDGDSNEKETVIFGVSLDPKKAGQKPKYEISKESMSWIESEMAKSKRQKPADLSSLKDFFDEEPARVVGYIKGYDPRMGFNTAIIYTENLFTNESTSSLLEIQPDGRFTADIKLTNPKKFSFLINKHFVSVYIEPGQTVGIVLDWQDFLYRDRHRDQWREHLKVAQYVGPLAQINRELFENQSPMLDYSPTDLSIADYKTQQMELWKSQLAEVDRLAVSKNLTPQAVEVLRSDVNTTRAMQLSDFIDRYIYDNSQNDYERNMKLKDSLSSTDFYDFFQSVPMNDHRLLLSNMSTMLINRFEFLQPFRDSWNRAERKEYPDPEKGFYEYLIDEVSSIEFNDEDMQFRSLLDSLSSDLVSAFKEDQMRELYERLNLMHKKFENKYKPYRPDYDAKYMTESFEVELFNLQKIYDYKDSVLVAKLGLQPSLIYDIVKTRALHSDMERSNQDLTRKLVTYVERGMVSPYAVVQAEKMYAAKFPTKPISHQTFKLPEGKANDIFQKLIEPFKGKIVVIDFWAINCGPCMSGLKSSKEVREKYKDSEDIVFLFITDEKNSPAEAYAKTVQEQGLINSHRVSVDDYNYISELLNIYGIPHYTLIGRDGEVLERRFHFYDYANQINEFILK